MSHTPTVTEEMLKAGMDIYFEHDWENGEAGPFINRVYSAMLAAAPLFCPRVARCIACGADGPACHSLTPQDSIRTIAQRLRAKGFADVPK